MSLLSKANNMQIDATYKLTVYEFPVIEVGFSDNTKRFFCSGIIISKFEDCESY